MKRSAVVAWLFVYLLAGAALFADGKPVDADDRGRGPTGYAGPGWSILFGAHGTAEMASLGPVMFRISDRIFLGPLIAYEESSSEGPGFILGGAKVEGYLNRLSSKFYSTSAGVSILAGAESINDGGQFAAQINAELNANVLIFPSFCLGTGPMLSLRLDSSALTVHPGFTFSVKEGTGYSDTPIFKLKEDGPRVCGYWQGLWTFVNDEAVFVDGGGTRLELPSGLAFGITGGVLRQRVEDSGSDLAVMLTGVTAEWNGHVNNWLTITPRVASGLAMYGWIAPDDSIDGGPHFMIRPELCTYLRILPFMEIGGGVGYQFVAGEAETAIPMDALSSAAFSVQVRVGEF